MIVAKIEIPNPIWTESHAEVILEIDPSSSVAETRKTEKLRVCVSTLSKQIHLSLPQTLILGGLMQKMPAFFRRFWAYTVPTVMAAGRAGGTTIVMMSKARSTTFFVGACEKII